MKLGENSEVEFNLNEVQGDKVQCDYKAKFTFGELLIMKKLITVRILKIIDQHALPSFYGWDKIEKLDEINSFMLEGADDDFE